MRDRGIVREKERVGDSTEVALAPVRIPTEKTDPSFLSPLMLKGCNIINHKQTPQTHAGPFVRLSWWDAGTIHMFSQAFNLDLINELRQIL